MIINFYCGHTRLRCGNKAMTCRLFLGSAPAAAGSACSTCRFGAETFPGPLQALRPGKGHKTDIRHHTLSPPDTRALGWEAVFSDSGWNQTTASVDVLFATSVFVSLLGFWWRRQSPASELYFLSPPSQRTAPGCFDAQGSPRPSALRPSPRALRDPFPLSGAQICITAEVVSGGAEVKRQHQYKPPLVFLES